MRAGELLRAGRAAEALAAAQAGLRDGSVGDLELMRVAGAASHALGRPEDALRWFESVLAAAGDDIDARLAAAACRFDLGLTRSARESLETLLANHPGLVGAWRNLALAREACADPEGALAALQEARRLAPEHPGILRDHAALLLRLARAHAAFEVAMQARQLDADNPRGLHLLLEAALKCRNVQVAMDAARTLLARDGADHHARRGLAAALAVAGDFAAARGEIAAVPVALADGFDPERIALSSGAESLREADWRVLESWSALAGEVSGRPGASLPESEFAHQSLASGVAPVTCGRLFAAWSAGVRAAHVTAVWPRAPRGRRARLRIAYLGAGFGDHPSAQIVSPLLAAHDRAGHDVHVYATTIGDAGPWRAEIEERADVFHAVPHLDARALAGRIACDDIDVLVDVTGANAYGRPGVHAHRPARSHLLLFGTPAALPLDGVDAMIGDAVAFDAGDAGVRLPCAFLPVDPRWVEWANAGAAPARAAHGLPEDAPILCAMHAAYKIEPHAFDLWMRILRACPAAILWLSDAPERTRARLRSAAAAAGVAGGRLIFAPRVPIREHMRRLRLATVLLDTSYYGAQVTGAQALAVGLPLLTRRGDRFSARVGASLLTHAGLADLVATDDLDYVARALAFCHADPAAQQARRRTAEAFTREACAQRLETLVRSLEAVYAEALRRALDPAGPVRLA
ncbi:MAG: tetratricopeptide repeat protein [Burkholderiales bacterium]|nr:tetratricopeptide repeat protein [Burkholderiales bacterium]